MWQLRRACVRGKGLPSPSHGRRFRVEGLGSKVEYLVWQSCRALRASEGVVAMLHLVWVVSFQSLRRHPRRPICRQDPCVPIPRICHAHIHVETHTTTHATSARTYAIPPKRTHYLWGQTHYLWGQSTHYLWGQTHYLWGQSRPGHCPRDQRSEEPACLK